MTNLFTKLARAYNALFLLTICTTLISANTSLAQVTVTATAGTTGPTAYTTVNAAFAAINAGTHQGAIQIAISANTTEPAAPTVLAASGVGASSYTSLMIYPTATNVVIIGSSNTSTGVLVFNGADNITINGNLNNGSGTTRDLEIQNNQGGATPGSHAVLWFQGSTTSPQLGCTNIVIKNTLIRGNGNPNATSATSPYVVGLAFAGTSFPASTSIGANHANITLDNNLFQKAGTAIQMGNATAAPITGLNIINNVIGSNFAADYVYHRGMWLSNTSAALIKQNHIFNIIVGTVQTITRIGMEVTGTGSTSAMIERNHIHSLANFHTGGYSGYGIILSGGSNHTILNNLIYDITGTSWNTQTDAATGIRMTSGTGHKIYYNSINLYGALTGTTTSNAVASSPVVITSTAVTGIDIRNNILNNKSTAPNAPTSEHMAIWFPASYNFGAVGNIFNNNGYLVTGGSANHYVAKVGTTTGSGLYADLSALQALTGQDAQSVPLVNLNAPFTADNNLTIPAGTNTSLESGGVVISSLGLPNIDYTGATRPAGSGTAPDIGAFEFEGVVPSGCSTTPSPGSATISQTSVCIGQGVDLTLSGQTVDIGIEINWQQSSTGTMGSFTDIPGAVDPVYSSGPLASTTYFRARVTCSGATPPDAFSNEVSVTVNNPQILTTSSGQRCGPGTVTLGATADPQYDINWYENSNGGAPVGSGSSFITPVLNSTTTYYVAANLGGGVGSAGLTNAISTTGYTLEAGLFFDAFTNFTINGVHVYPMGTGAGTATIALQNSSGTTLESLVVNLTGTGSPYVKTFVPLNFNVPAGTNYRLVMLSRAGSVSGLIRESGSAWGTYPLTLPGTLSITNGKCCPDAVSTSYYYFYDWQVTIGCEGTRVPVTATINPAPPLTITANQTVCNNEVATLSVTSNIPDFDSYIWTPATDLYIDPAATIPYTGGSAATVYAKSSLAGMTTYIVNASNSITTCSDFTSTEVTVLPAIAPTAAASVNQICVSGTIDLSLSPAAGIDMVQWQVSLDDITFTDISGATTTTSTVTVTAPSKYYRAEIRNSAGVVCLTTNSVLITVENPEILSTTNGSRCGVGTVDLSAISSPGSTVNWYENQTGGTPLATGNNFTTPVISSSSTFYAAPTQGGFSTNVGLPQNITTTSTGVGTTNFGLVFDVYQAFTLQTVTLYPVSSSGASGTVTIDVINGSGVIMHTATVNVTGSPTPNVLPQTVTLNFNIQPGTNYKLRPGSFTGISSLLFEPSASAPGGNYGYPFVVPGVLSINHSTLTAAPTNTPRLDLYYYFYNWQIFTGCEGPRIPVTATVTAPPALDVTGDLEICDGTSTTLTVTTGASDYTNFVWSPSTGLNITTGTSVIASPTQSTEYTVIASGNVNGCQNTDIFTVDVIHVDADITSDISPVCGSTPANLTTTVFSEAATEIFANNTSMVIPATGTGASTGAPASVYPSSITVSGISPLSILRSVTLKNLSHEFPDDIDIVLVSPTNEYVILMSDAGGTNDYVNNTFVFREGAIALSDGGVNPSGVYKPSNFLTSADAFPAPGPGSITQLNPSLSLFTGDPNGTWSLYVVDDASGQVGTLDGWELEFIDYSSFSYNWTPTTGLSSSIISNPTALPPLGSTTYILTVTENNSGCIGTSSITLHRADPMVVSSNGDTRCGLGEVNLSASGQTGEVIAWWESASANQPLHIGNNFDPFVTNTTTYYVSSIGAALTSNVSTGFDANLLGTIAGATVGGNMFDIVAKGDMIIHSFDIHLHNDPTLGPSDVSVYIKQGSYVGSQLNAGAWTLAGSVTGVTSSGIGVPTPLPLDINLKILNGQTYGVYIAVTNLGVGNPLRYNNSAASPPLGSVAGGDANLDVLVGTANFGPFTTNVVAPDNRKWNGRVHYSLFCESSRVPVTANVTPAPVVEITGNSILCGNESVVLNITTGASDYTNFEWSPSTGLNTTQGSSVIASPVEDITYIVFASGNVNGCQITDTFDLEVVAPPQVAVTASGTFFCDVANAQLIANAGSGSETVGKAIYASTANTAGNNWGLVFDVMNQPVTIESVDVYSVGAGGQMTVELRSNTGSLIQTVGTYTYPAGSTANPVLVTFPLNLTVPVGTGYRLVSAAMSGNLIRETSGNTYPYTSPSGNISITSGFITNPGSATYYWFYNWKIAGVAVSYQWSPAIGLSNPAIANPIASPNQTTTYTVLITDTVTGCTTSESITITVGETPTPIISSTTPMPLCEGEFTTLSTQYSLTNGFTFSWNGGLSNDETITTNLPGEYTCIVTSSDGCTSTMVSFTVEVATIFVDSPVITDVLCNGDSTGTATINVLGTLYDPSGNITFGPFVYSANGGAFQSSPTLTGLWAGLHTIAVYDSASGCMTTISVTVSQPDPLTGTTSVVNNVSCFGGSNGTSTAQGFGGVGPYTYNWLTPIPKQVQTNDEIPAGTWTVVIEDANGCTVTATVTITEPTLLEVTLGPDRVVPWGSANGFTASGCTDVIPVITGGTTPYSSYLWSTGATTPTINVCQTVDGVFTYTVTVTDANGCTASATVNLIWSNIDCSNNSNGTKVKICMVPPGNPAGCHTVCISVSAASALLSNTPSYLGSCNPGCAPARIIAPEATTEGISVNIFPNPTTGRLMVDFMSEAQSANSIQVMDLQGRIVMNIALDGSSTFVKEIDLSMLENGMYILNIVNTESVISTSRVIKTQ